jgi:hypothetical protein
MAVLPEAIRTSDTQTAIYRSPHGYAVIVNRVTGREEPDSEEEYVVLVRRGTAPLRDRIAGLSLLEAIARMRGLSLTDFDPDNDQWEPTTLPPPEPAISPEDRQDYLSGDQGG